MKYTRTAAAAVASLALALAGCATSTDDGPEEESGDGPVTLRFQSLAFQEPTIKATEDIVDAWNKENPDIQVKYV
ncbi:MAG: sugar ABC transporter substrate-binding protein, partial [Nocardioides sp.]